MPQKNYKYRINDHLGKLPMKDYRAALEMIPGQLGISKNTFDNYRKIQIEDKQDIPHSIVDKLEKLFSMKPGELQNYTTDIRPIFEHTENLADLAGAIGLTKS